MNHITQAMAFVQCKAESAQLAEKEAGFEHFHKADGGRYTQADPFAKNKVTDEAMKTFNRL